MRRGRDYLFLFFRPGSRGGGGTALVVGSNLPPVFGSYVPGFGLVIGFPLPPSTCICGRERAYAARKRRGLSRPRSPQCLPPTLTRRPARPRISATTFAKNDQRNSRSIRPSPATREVLSELRIREFVIGRQQPDFSAFLCEGRSFIPTASLDAFVERLTQIAASSAALRLYQPRSLHCARCGRS